MKPQCVIRTRLDTGSRIATICQHCPDKGKGDAWAIANSFEPSHGICVACAEIHYSFLPKNQLDSLREGIKKNSGTFID